MATNYGPQLRLSLRHSCCLMTPVLAKAREQIAVKDAVHNWHKLTTRQTLMCSSWSKHCTCREVLALPGLLIILGVTWVVILGCFFLWSQNTRVPQTQTFEKIIFYLEMLPGPAPVLVTWLPGPPSASVCPSVSQSQN